MPTTRKRRIRVHGSFIDTDVSAINSTIAVADGLLARRGLALEIGWISVPRNVIKRRTPPDE